MENIIRKIVLRLFPELSAQLHLPRWGKVVALPELPEQDGERGSDPFYPRWAADIQLLDENGTATKSKVLQAVPLPLIGAGKKAGYMQPPAIGSIVEIAFAYGRPDKPFIRTVLPMGWELPAIKEGECRIQTREGVYQHIDETGNITTETDENLTTIIGKMHDVLVKQSQKITVLEDQLTEVTGKVTMLVQDEMAVTVGEDLKIQAKNITQDAQTIKLNGGVGVVTCAHICHFTGAPHGDGSTTVTAGE